MHRQYTATEALQQFLGESSNDEDTEDMDDGGGSEINKVIANPTDVDSVGNEDLVEDLVQQIHVEAGMMVSKNGREQWSKLPLSENSYGRTQRHNFLREAQGPTNAVKNLCGQSPQAAFKFFLTHSIIQQIADLYKFGGGSCYFYQFYYKYSFISFVTVTKIVKNCTIYCSLDLHYIINVYI